MSDKFSHEHIIYLLNEAQRLANKNRLPYCLTRVGHIVAERTALSKGGHSNILETCRPITKKL